MLDQIRNSLGIVGYRSDLLRESYTFSDVGESGESRRADFVGFAQEPPSYESACVAFTILGDASPQSVQRLRFLGAPYVFSVNPRSGEATWWVLQTNALPERHMEFAISELSEIVESNRQLLAPQVVMRAKQGYVDASGGQLSLFPLDFLPAIDQVVFEYLDGLLARVVTAGRSAYEETEGQPLDDSGLRKLFRLVFRFLAAKMLADRSYPGDWLNTNAGMVISAVEQHYYTRVSDEPALTSPVVRDVVWSTIRESLNLHNISPKSLAFVYENTFVSDETRSHYDTHATPHVVAEWVLRNLPIESISHDERYIFEPFCGHAPFLVAALGRLRSLLPDDMTLTGRHEYLRNHLLGIELDPFAYEVARYSLTLADYPQPNDWFIHEGNVFTSPETSAFLARARVVVFNPPFGRLSKAEMAAMSSVSNDKVVEALRLVVNARPPMLGMVLPGRFYHAKSYDGLRREIDRRYQEVHALTLPESAFRFSDFETVAIIAYGERNGAAVRSHAKLSRRDFSDFAATGQLPPLTRSTWVSDKPASTGSPAIFSRDRLGLDIQEATKDLDRIGDVAEIHRGIEYDDDIRLHVHSTDGPKRKAGLHKADPSLEPFFLTNVKFLDIDEAFMRGNAHKYPWGDPKVVANAVRMSRQAWTIVAAPDYDGLVCTQNFHGIWPTRPLPLEVLSAVLSGPVANFMIALNRGPTSRHNNKTQISALPFPAFSEEQSARIVYLVNAFRDARNEYANSWGQTTARCHALLLQIDAAVLDGYNLPPRMERALLDRFEDSERPGIVQMDRYYPAGFAPSIPLSTFISDDFAEAKASRTLARLKGVNLPDPSIWLSNI